MGILFAKQPIPNLDRVEYPAEKCGDDADNSGKDTEYGTENAQQGAYISGIDNGER